MSILGLTIDYGPYGWLEGFDFGWTPNTTDSQHKRYRYGNQPNIGLWNLYQLANALYPLVEEAKPLEAILELYKIDFEHKSLEMMRAKLGLIMTDKNDLSLIQKLEDILQATETDMTIFFRNLSKFQKNKQVRIDIIKDAFYEEKLSEATVTKWINWLDAYKERLQIESITDTERQTNMDLVNPKYLSLIHI